MILKLSLLPVFFLASVLWGNSPKTAACSTSPPAIILTAATPGLSYEQQLAKEQAEFYRLQSEKLRSESLVQKLADNPSGIMTVFGAFIAAIVALVSFLFNYKATLRNQSDTQFYEALKLFGDKESATLRTSAVMLLANMGTRGRRRSRPYFKTSLDQLLTGLLLEENSIAQITITDGIQQLTRVDQPQVVGKLQSLNRRLQLDLIDHLAKFFALKGITKAEAVETDAWNEAAVSTPYEEPVLRHLAELLKIDFEHSLRRAQLGKSATNGDALSKLQTSLQTSANRMSLCVAICSDAIRHFPKPNQLERFRRRIRLSYRGALRSLSIFPFPSFLHRFYSKTFYGMFLVEASIDSTDIYDLDLSDTHLQDATISRSIVQTVNLDRANLRGVDMSESLLQDVDLANADLRKANLRSVKISDAWLRGAQLQEADLSWSKLTRVSLQNARMEGVKLQGARLSVVDLSGADLSKADVSQATLSGATINAETNLTEANWWQADFYKEDNQNLDVALIEELQKRYKVAVEHEKLHPSVKEFFKKGGESV